MIAIRFALLAAVVVLGTVGALAPVVAADKNIEHSNSERTRAEPSLESDRSLAKRIEALEAAQAQLREQVATDIDHAQVGVAIATTLTQLRLGLIALGIGLIAGLYEIRRLKRQLGASGDQR